MANQEQLEILKQGVHVWNEWREKNRHVKIDLSQASLEKVNLNYVNFNDANLSDADFRNALLKDTHLTGANLTKADLSGASLLRATLAGAELNQTKFKKADLRIANLVGTSLIGADFSGANLSSANLSWSDISGSHFTDLTGVYLNLAILNDVDLSGVIVGETTFCNLDLSVVKGLETVDHHGPSTIGTNTIAKSKGKIPEVFLRGCGLSDIDIEYAKLANSDLTPEWVTDITYKIHQLYLGGGIQYYSCFISYSSKDQEFAQQLHEDLQNNGVRCWFDREDLKIGDAIRPTIDRQIRLRDKLMVILSENSIKSEWVGDEVEGALEEEQKGNRSVLFPIRLDDTVLNTRDDWAAKIKRRRHIGDFSNWIDKASYQKAFERLLRDLKATIE